MADPQPWPGTAYPLSATYDGAGTNFTLFSEIADSPKSQTLRNRRQGGAVSVPDGVGTHPMTSW
jgi:hypothetical protein